MTPQSWLENNKKLYRPETRSWTKCTTSSRHNVKLTKYSLHFHIFPNMFFLPWIKFKHLRPLEKIKMAMRKTSKAPKRLLFMKIYNFAMEVYDSPGSGIGRWRSCGQQEWELISHEVILQLLFSSAHSLNTTNTNLFLALCIRITRTRCCCGCWTCVISPPPTQKNKKQSGRWSLRAMPWLCARHANVALYVRENEGSSHSWMVGLLSWNHLNKVGKFGERTERSFGGVAPTQEMMDYQQR